MWLNELARACRDGMALDVSDILESEGAESLLNSKDSDGWCALHFACIRNDLYIVRSLLMQSRIDVNSKNNAGQTPTHLACFDPDYEVLEELIMKGASIDIVDGFGETALDVAMHHSDDESVLELLRGYNGEKQSGGMSRNTGFENFNGDTVAIKTLDISLFFANRQSRGKAREHSSKETRGSIFELARDGRGEDIVEYAKKNDVAKVTDIDGWYPLHFACINGHYKAAVSLLDAGAFPNCTTHSGQTIIRFAILGANWELVRTMISRGGSVSHSDLKYAVGAPKDIASELSVASQFSKDADKGISNGDYDNGSFILDWKLVPRYVVRERLKDVRNPDEDVGDDFELQVAEVDIFTYENDDIKVGLDETPPGPGEAENQQKNLDRLEQDREEEVEQIGGASEDKLEKSESAFEESFSVVLRDRDTEENDRFENQEDVSDEYMPLLRNEVEIEQGRSGFRYLLECLFPCSIL